MFSYDSRLYAAMTLFSYLAYGSALWLLFSLPVVTVPAATAGLFAMMRQRATAGPSGATSAFIGGFRGYFAASYGLAALCLAAVGALAADAVMLTRAHQPLLLGALLVVGTCACGVAVHAWPALVMTHSVRAALREAGIRTLLRPDLTLLAVICWTLPLWLFFVVPHQALVPVAVVAVSLPALVATHVYDRSAPRGTRARGETPQELRPSGHRPSAHASGKSVRTTERVK